MFAAGLAKAAPPTATPLNAVIAPVLDISGNGTNNYPVGVALSADGARLYNTLYTASDVRAFDTATNNTLTTRNIGTNQGTGGIALCQDISRAGTTAAPGDYHYLYVANSITFTVSVLDVSNSTLPIVDTMGVGADPQAVAMSPDCNTVYVANRGDGVSISNTVSIIDSNPASATFNQVIDTVDVGLNPTGLVVAPDNAHVYVYNYGDGTVSIIDTGSHAVTTTAAFTSAGTTPTLAPAGGISILPNGSTLYIATGSNHTVVAMNTTAPYATTTVSGLPTATAMMFATTVGPDGSGGSLVYATYYTQIQVFFGQRGTMYVIDPATNAMLTSVGTGTSAAIGSQPTGLVVSRDGGTIFVADGGGTPGPGVVERIQWLSVPTIVAPSGTIIAPNTVTAISGYGAAFGGSVGDSIAVYQNTDATGTPLCTATVVADTHSPTGLAWSCTLTDAIADLGSYDLTATETTTTPQPIPPVAVTFTPVPLLSKIASGAFRIVAFTSSAPIPALSPATLALLALLLAGGAAAVARRTIRDRPDA